MSSLFADVLGTATAAEPSSAAAAALFSAASAFKRDRAPTKGSKNRKNKNERGMLLDAVGKHAASRRRQRATKTAPGADDAGGEEGRDGAAADGQLGLLRSQAEAAAQAAATAREQEGGGTSDGSDSSDSDGEGEEGAGSGGEAELERLAALSDEGEREAPGEGGEEEKAPAPGPPPSAATHASLTPEQQRERLSRTVFVGNVSPTSKRKALKRTFSEFGAVESVRLRSVPLAKGTLLPRRAAVLAKRADASRKGGACAYVVFAERAGAEGALRLNMGEIGGNVVRVDFASAPSARGTGGGESGSAAAADAPPAALSRPAPPSLYDPALSVFVGNLPPDVEEAELVALFGGRGAVSAVRVVRDPATSLGKGFAFVLLRDAATAAAAKARDGMLLKGRPVRVRKAAKDPGALVAARQRREGTARDGGGRGGGGRGAGRGGGFAGRGRGRGPATPADRLRAAAGAPGAAAAAGWQGVKTKGRGGKVSRGSSGAPRAGGPSSGPSSSPASGRGAAAGKRPSVAARKEASKLKVRGGGVQEKGSGKKNKQRHRKER